MSSIAQRVSQLPPALSGLWGMATVSALTWAFCMPLWIQRTGVALTFPVHDPWTPMWLQDPRVYAGLLIVMASTATVAAIRPTTFTLRLYAGVQLAGAILLLGHTLTFGWAGSIALFWTGAFACWLAWTKHAIRAPGLCLLTIGGFFLWPALGKCTPTYLDGSRFYALHGVDGAGVHALLAQLGADVHRQISRYLGIGSAVTELAVAFAWMLPGRWGFVVAGAGCTGILLFGGPGFLDTIGYLAAMLVAGWRVQTRTSQPRPAA